MNKQEEFKANIIKSCVEGKTAALRLKLSERHAKKSKEEVQRRRRLFYFTR